MNKTIVLMVVLLSACGSGNSSPHNSPQAGLSPTAVIEARAMAEATGKLPKLDRTTSILGVDANSNGVRDDVEAWIDSRPDTPVQKAAMKGFSSALSMRMNVDTSSFLAVQAAGDASMKSMECIYDSYGFDAGNIVWEDVRKYTINTKERFDAYMLSNKAMSGHSFKSYPKDAACAP